MTPVATSFFAIPIVTGTGGGIPSGEAAMPGFGLALDRIAPPAMVFTPPIAAAPTVMPPLRSAEPAILPGLPGLATPSLLMALNATPAPTDTPTVTPVTIPSPPQVPLAIAGPADDVVIDDAARRPVVTPAAGPIARMAATSVLTPVTTSAIGSATGPAARPVVGQVPTRAMVTTGFGPTPVVMDEAPTLVPILPVAPPVEFAAAPAVIATAGIAIPSSPPPARTGIATIPMPVRQDLAGGDAPAASATPPIEPASTSSGPVPTPDALAIGPMRTAPDATAAAGPSTSPDDVEPAAAPAAAPVSAPILAVPVPQAIVAPDTSSPPVTAEPPADTARAEADAPAATPETRPAPLRVAETGPHGIEPTPVRATASEPVVTPAPVAPPRHEPVGRGSAPIAAPMPPPSAALPDPAIDAPSFRKRPEPTSQDEEAAPGSDDVTIPVALPLPPPAAPAVPNDAIRSIAPVAADAPASPRDTIPVAAAGVEPAARASDDGVDSDSSAPGTAVADRPTAAASDVASRLHPAPDVRSEPHVPPAMPAPPPPTHAAPAPTAAAPSSPRPAPPVDAGTVSAQPGRIGQEMGVTIARHAATGGGETIVVRLDPQDMGRIEVKLSFEESGTLRAVVAADNPAALDLLRRDSADLNRALADAGVRADQQSLRFDTRAGTDGGNGQPWQRRPDAPARAPHPDFADAPVDDPIHRPLATSGRVDMMA